MADFSERNGDLLDGSAAEMEKLSAKYGNSAFGFITGSKLAALRDGDHSAYNEIYLRCFEPMKAFIRVLLHDDVQAEELCQEMFIRLWEIRGRINPESNFRALLYTMAKTSAFNELKHRKVISRYRDYRQREEPQLEYSADELMMESELALIIDISLENMPEQRRRVFRMNREEGMTTEQIAAKLNISPSTVRNHLSLAMKELKELIALFLLFFML